MVTKQKNTSLLIHQHKIQTSTKLSLAFRIRPIQQADVSLGFSLRLRRGPHAARLPLQTRVRSSEAGKNKDAKQGRVSRAPFMLPPLQGTKRFKLSEARRSTYSLCCAVALPT